MKHVSRYAVVGGPDWLEDMMAFVNPLFKTDIRHFDLDDEDEAWNWLDAEPMAEQMEVALDAA